MSIERILAVHCGASHVSCGRFSPGPGKPVLEDFATRLLPASDLTEPDWVAAVSSALLELKRSEGLRGECVVDLPGHLTFQRLLRVPRVTDRQRRRIVEFEQGQGMPTPAEEMVWCHAPVTDSEYGQELILAAAKRRIIADLGARIREIGLFPRALLPAWLVLRHAIVSCPPAAGDALVLSVGARSSQLMLCGAGRFFALTIPVGGNLITQTLAEELQLDFQSAETLKLRGSAAAPERGDAQRERKSGQRALDQFVRRLCVEIQRSPPLALPEGNPARPSALYLTGGGSRFPGFPGALAERLELRVERWDGICRLEPGRTDADREGASDDGQLADLIGLAACAAHGLGTEANLLPRSFRHERILRRHWPWLAGIVLIGMIGGQQPAWRWRRKTCELRQQAAELDAAVSALHRIQVLNQSNLARAEETGRQIAALQKLAAARSGWIVLLGDLQARLADVEDAWIDRLQLLPADSPASTGGRRAPPAGSGAAALAGGPRIQISGNLFDVATPVAVAGDRAVRKATALRAALLGSSLVSAIEREQFDDSQPGLLRFEIILRLAPHALN